MALPPERVFAEVAGRRLNPDTAAPLAVGVSGGGDSVALLAMAVDWATRQGRRVLALTVDHGLQADGAHWAAETAEVAKRLGATPRALRWEGPKPATGVSAAARSARHRLLAEAAREAGASVLLLGHTADDRLEAAAMRADGVPLGGLSEWAPSPVWPEGRGVMLLRPLLDVRRGALRAWLRERGLPWIDDPTNDDPRSARARARSQLARDGAYDPDPAPQRRRSRVLESVEITLDGRIVMHRAAVNGSPDARRDLATALACAAGREGAVRSNRLTILLERLGEPVDFVTTLGGARVDVVRARVTVSREPGRAPAPDRRVQRAGEVFDGRWEVADGSGGTMGLLAGRLLHLPDAQRRAVSQVVPAYARGALPALIAADGAVTCPLFDPASRAKLIPLVPARLTAALGGVVREA